jgi:hypothetical protein
MSHPKPTAHVAGSRVGAVAAVAAAVLVLLGGGAAARATSRQARVRVVDLIATNPRISARALRRARVALQAQANGDLREWWPGPRVRVVIAPASSAGKHPWELVIARPLAHVRGQDTLIGGAHGVNSTGGVSGFAFPTRIEPWTMSASHELLEMLEDPTGSTTRDGYALEICDPVETAGYQLDGVMVSDFVTPAWFTARTHRQYDYLGLLHHPRRQLN